MKILIINSAERGINQFVHPLEEIVLESRAIPDMINYQDTLHTNISLYDGILISGSPRGDDIVEHHLPYFQWILNCPKPILGICAGHHITGKLFNAELIRDSEKEKGDLLVFVDQRDPIFNSYSDKFLVRQNHNDSITLPGMFILLAHSQRCRVSMMKHQTQPIYSMQFHPEILNKKLLLNFFDICAALRT